MPASRILRRARVSRCAIAGSEIRNARATSAVVRPLTWRSVSAMRTSGASAGWQQAKISSRRSSGIAAAAVSARGQGGDLVGERLEAPVAAQPVERARCAR